ncbi:MAG: hypothetical protein P8P26_10585 [Porticoccaceae bacterium]|nr:hypothetical protein [Porticoccaceae bacterium]
MFVGNPEGFDTEQAFSLGEIHFTVDQDSLATDIIVVKTLRIIAPEVTIEPARGGSNLDRIQENVLSYLGTSEAVVEDEPSAKNIIIQDLLITGGELQYGLLGATTLNLPLPEIHLTHIGEEGQGVSMDQASAKIIAAISKGATKEAMQSGSIKDVRNKLETQLKDKASGLKKLFKN